MRVALSLRTTLLLRWKGLFLALTRRIMILDTAKWNGARDATIRSVGCVVCHSPPSSVHSGRLDRLSEASLGNVQLQEYPGFRGLVARARTTRYVATGLRNIKQTDLRWQWAEGGFCNLSCPCLAHWKSGISALMASKCGSNPCIRRSAIYVGTHLARRHVVVWPLLFWNLLSLCSVSRCLSFPPENEFERPAFSESGRCSRRFSTNFHRAYCHTPLTEVSEPRTVVHQGFCKRFPERPCGV